MDKLRTISNIRSGAREGRGRGRHSMNLDETTPLTTSDGVTLSARRLKQHDRKALQDFNRSLKPETERWFRAHKYDDQTVARILARSEAGDDLTLGLFDGNRIAGYFFLWYFKQPVPLLGIGLQDDYQGRGLGVQMMELLIREARKAHKTGIELTTCPDNERAFALYRKVGFEYYKDVPNVQGDGRTVIERAMFYAIRPGATPGSQAHKPPVE